ncbi:hypothetical protein CDAR_604901 [Caerostris darwini]|uniref:Uncharacterized protein n=1 Tax=Caerostris darwini TaxID=1538125 RepID=A0AAV4VCR4_9ARAC|nr:hypothetical protein CDAR_604901 [Caerostris darwini]
MAPNPRRNRRWAIPMELRSFICMGEDYINLAIFARNSQLHDMTIILHDMTIITTASHHNDHYHCITPH